jgi:hypothetical protein
MQDNKGKPQYALTKMRFVDWLEPRDWANRICDPRGGLLEVVDPRRG